MTNFQELKPEDIFKTTLRDMFTKEALDPQMAEIAKALAMCSVRNTYLEDLHAGITPTTHTGDYSDVTITDANGETFPFSELSRINDQEMKILMKEVVSRLYASLMVISSRTRHEEAEYAVNLGEIFCKKWDNPDASFLDEHIKRTEERTKKMQSQAQPKR